MSDAALSVVSPAGCLGYGIHAASLERAFQMAPDCIGADCGSTDSGPYYLGSGQIYQSEATMRRDLRLLLAGARAHGIPLVIGSAANAGARPHVEWMRKLIFEIAEELRLEFRLAVIWADQDPEYLKRAVRNGRVTPMPGVPSLTDDILGKCNALVAQMGTAPLVKALNEGADVILAGRACDSAVFGCFGIWRGFDRGLALHMGKVIECGALCAEPPTGRDVIVGILRASDFVIRAPNPERQVTPESVTAHMVYEVENPELQEEPDGTQDFSEVRTEAGGDGSTRVWNSRFIPRKVPTLRFEGTELRGYRSFVFGGVRDPDLIEAMREFTAQCEAEVRDMNRDTAFEIDWKVYGQNAVLGSMEPNESPNHEVGVLAQVLAPSQATAHDVAALLEARMIGFTHKESRTSTANVAFPFCPVVNDTGPVYRFSVCHVVEMESEDELVTLFPCEWHGVKGASSRGSGETS